MPLSEITDRAIELNTTRGTTRTHNAIASFVALTKTAAHEIQEEAFEVAARKLIHDRATKQMRATAHSDPRQRSFFSLHARYALEVDHRVYKDTERLTRLEWRSVLALRRKQLADDAAHLTAMEEADREFAPIWDRFPRKLLGQIEKIYLTRRAKSAAA